MQFFLGFKVIWKRIKAIRFMMMDKSVPKRKKALVIAGIIYLFLPVDIIPPVLFTIAWIDDLILWLWILWHLRDVLDKYWMGEKPVDYSKKYKNAIDDVDFEVKDDDKEEK
ncbi:MAG: DUF1232 domain-containing protein [Eubacteriaceae bacterium]|nr:DUF1232 domain-containing protein [Eubacteriaceae bacterium]